MESHKNKSALKFKTIMQTIVLHYIYTTTVDVFCAKLKRKQMRNAPFPG